MTELLSLLTRIAEADNAEAVWDISVIQFAQWGFSHANYGFTRFKSDRSIGDPDDALFLSTWDAARVQRYFRSNFFARTPVYRWAERNVGSCTWTWVKNAHEAGTLSPDEAETVRQNAAAGVVAGVSVSFPANSTRAKGALGLIACPGLSHVDVDAIYAARRPEIEVLAHMMHLKLIQLPIPSRRRPLTSRQREALEWVADGKTSQDVALLMGVSAAMIEKHLRLARETLDVETTAQAVAKAALLNQIFHRRPAPMGAVAAR
ncbi:MAG: helix-turn-helix transcriptional regulator [Paracoccaceae bacterium]